MRVGKCQRPRHHFSLRRSTAQRCEFFCKYRQLRRSPLNEHLLAGRAEGDHAVLRLARRPAALQRVRQHGGAYGTTEMMLALAPIDASPAQRALLASDGLNIKATADEKTAPFVSQFDDLTVPA